MSSSVSELTRPIYVFASEYGGVVPFCSNQVCERLSDVGINSARVIKITDTSYLDRVLSSDSSGTLVIPGGHSHIIATTLENSVTKIQSAVRHGWDYLGLCAGGNFACKSLIVYSAPNPSGIRAPFNFAEHTRFLNLLPVDAIADVYPLAQKNIQGGDNARVITIETDTEKFDCFWNEGSKFILPLEHTLTVEARYADLADKPIAILSGKYGFGNVTITGVHPEADFSLSKKVADKTEDDRYMFEQFGGLWGVSIGSYQKRKDFLRYIFSNVGILPKREA